MPDLSPNLDRASVIRHLTHATRNGFDHRMADKLLAAYDLGLIVCKTGHDDAEMQVHYTPVGYEWNLQGQPWGVA